MNNKAGQLIFSIIFSIILVFAVDASCAVLLTQNMISSPEFCISQVESTDTYESVYNSIIKKFSDNYSESSIPVSVYQKSFSKIWVKNAINEQIISSFQQFENENAVNTTEYTEISQNITEYFEEYAHEKHVVKDEKYDKRLSEEIASAEKIVSSMTDVYQLETMKRSGIWSKISKLRNIITEIKPFCIAAVVVLVIILIILRSPVYWTGTAFFAAGLIIIIPSAYLMITSAVMKFSVKEYTVYNLVTGTLNTVINNTFISGILISASGAALISMSMLYKFLKNRR